MPADAFGYGLPSLRGRAVAALVDCIHEKQRREIEAADPAHHHGRCGGSWAGNHRQGLARTLELFSASGRRRPPLAGKGGQASWTKSSYRFNSASERRRAGPRFYSVRE